MSTPADDLVRRWRDRAWETLDDATYLAAGGRWISCVNRLYYACFYAVTALLTKHGLSSSRHTGVRGLLNAHFGRTGLIEPELTSVYNYLFDRRQRGDYIALSGFSEQEVRPWLGDVRRLLERIDELLAMSSTE